MSILVKETENTNFDICIWLGKYVQVKDDANVTSLKAYINNKSIFHCSFD